MIDISHVAANRHGRVFHILGKPGDWEYLRDSGVGRSTRYIFARPNAKNPDKRVELSLSYDQVQDKVYEVTARFCKPENFRIDLARLEAIRRERV